MADIMVPEPVSYAPQTIGWWILAGVLVCAIGVAVFFILRHRKANAYRREAIRELRALSPRIHTEKVAEDAFKDLAALVRRTALAAYPRERVASLHGEDWLTFLDSTVDGSFREGPARALVTAPYDGGKSLSADDRAELVEVVRLWVGTHRRGNLDA